MRASHGSALGLSSCLAMGLLALFTGCTDGSGSSSSSSSSSTSSSSSSSGGGGSSGGGSSAAPGSSAGGVSGVSQAGSAGSAASAGSGVSAGSRPASSFSLPSSLGNVDAGFRPYTGEPENGVKCGTALCTPDAGTALCCISILSGMAGCKASCTPTLEVAGVCDGPEDCGTGLACCMRGLQGSSCGAQSACAGGSGINAATILCNTSTDCPAGYGCCESATLKSAVPAVDVGACVQGCM